MRIGRFGMVGLLGASLLAGCESPEARQVRRLGPAAEIVSASINNLGWQQARREAKEVSFTAIVTTYDETGRRHADRQEMVVDLERNTLTSTGATPQGWWQATVKGETCRLKGQKGVETWKVADRMAPTLVTLLHRMRGPLNLLRTRERARTADRTIVGGQQVVRVGVGGDNRMAVAYYFGAVSGMLRFVTAGADAAGGDGTVTAYEYAAEENGMIFPNTVDVRRLGRHVLLGAEPVFKVEISHVTF